MAINLLSKRVQIGRLPMGQNGCVEVWGTWAFSTTDANGTILVPLRQIEASEFTLLNAPNTDEEIYISGATVTDGTIWVGSDQLITIARVGTKTSGLRFMAKFRGQSL
jgi:hypothetical protein